MLRALIRIAFLLLLTTTAGAGLTGCSRSDDVGPGPSSPRRPSYYRSPLGPGNEPRRLPPREAPADDGGILRPIGE